MGKPRVLLCLYFFRNMHVVRSLCCGGRDVGEEMEESRGSHPQPIPRLFVDDEDVPLELLVPHDPCDADVLTA